MRHKLTKLEKLLIRTSPQYRRLHEAKDEMLDRHARQRAQLDQYLAAIKDELRLRKDG
jgi:hypothetical protein